MSRSRAPIPLLVVLALVAGAVPAAGAALPTNAADNLRTGWYPDQPGLAPTTVSGSNFGRLFTTNVQGQVYAQPLVWNDTLLVVTEDDHVYGLDPANGTIRWHRSDLGTPFDASDVFCGDLTPHIGITATPTIDPATGVAYFTAKSYDSSSGRPRYDLHAIDVATGAEQPHFPVQISGSADNQPGTAFDARYELQRPGLLLMDGVVYLGFGSHCDVTPYQGWVVGVDASDGHVTARWVATHDGEDGAGIWQAGGGLVSDADGELLVTTGNGDAPVDPAPGSSPPGGLGEAAVRLHVQPDGRLRPTDFFAPYDADLLDRWDADFGSTPPTVLPRPWFGDRHLVVTAGKTGYLYLLDGDDLGGIRQSPSGADKVLQKLGPLGGAWTRIGVWPGDGGWLYYPTAASGLAASGSAGKLYALQFGVDGTGAPRLSVGGQAADDYGFGSGAPVVTSDGTTSGTALVWVIYAPAGDGYGAELRAYDPLPVGGTLQLRRSFAIGRAAKFTPPGVAGGRVFVGTREGTVQGFGVPATTPLSGSGASFPTTLVGDTSDPIDLSFTATQALTVTGVDVDGPFGAGLLSRTTLADGESATLPVTFSPSTWGQVGGTLTLRTTAGDVSVGLIGRGLEPDGLLVASHPVVNFEGVVPGQRADDALVLTNVGATPVQIQAIDAPTTPFGLSGLPDDATLASGEQLTFSVSFSPATPGLYGSDLRIHSDDGEGPLTIGLTGVSVTPAHLVISPAGLDFGTVALGAAATRTFHVENTGGAPATITKSKPPALGTFLPATPGSQDGNPLPEGSVIAGGHAVDVTVRFTPAAFGPAADGWVLNATDDGGGVRTVGMSGTGVPPLSDPGGGTGGGAGGTGGGAGETGGGASSAPPDAAGLAFAHASLRLHRVARVARIRLACARDAAAACRGRVLLYGRVAGRRMHMRRLGGAHLATRRGHRAVVRVRLVRWARRALAHGHALRGRAVLRTRDADGTLVELRVRLTLMPRALALVRIPACERRRGSSTCQLR